MKEKESFWDKLRRPTRIAGFDPKTFKEKWGFNLTRLQLVSVITFFSLVVGIMVILLLIYSPIGNILPARISDSNRAIIEDQYAEMSELKKAVNAQEIYIKNLQDVILGKKTIDSVMISKPKEVEIIEEEIDTSRTENELRLIKDIDEIESVKIASTKNELKLVKDIDEIESVEIAPTKNTNTNAPNFILIDPIKGAISQKFNKKKHPGVDIVNKLNAPIKACADGVVMLAGYTIEDGNFIILSHSNGFSTYYKHTNKTLKNIGSNIKQGDQIALVGNSGENTNGPHLHFELWKDNEVLDPLDYLTFGN